ncbi:MAG: glutaredoxin domain-containing protein [Colwellia sp.]|nr:glutaredoxin domain-containing protein [Colwellia sp.]
MIKKSSASSSKLNKNVNLLPYSLYLKRLIMIACLFFTALTNSTEITNNVVEKPVLDIFVRDGCPHCTEAKKFLPSLAKQYPQLHIVVHSIDQNPSAKKELIERSKKAGVWPPGVPTFIFAGRVHVGFNSAEKTGPELIALINEKVTSIKDSSAQPTQTGIESEMLGNISVDRFGLPLFTFAIGLLDGFNPCAMWVLLFLLSLLVHLHDRKKMVIIAGTFVLVSGLVYYVFIAAWLNLFMFIGISITLMRILGGVALLIASINIKEFFSQPATFSLSIPETVKPGLYSRMRKIINAHSLRLSVLGVIVLAILVNFIELLCTAGFPALFIGILTQQELSTGMYYGYIGLYIFGYILDDTIMVTITVMALSSQKLSMVAGQRLKLLSGSVMFILGLVMLLRPSWLS